MKRALILAFLILIAAPAAFVAAGIQVDSQKENIVITESALYGNPQAAEGLRLRTMSQWDWNGPLNWETSYITGSGEAQSSFVFLARGRKPAVEELKRISLDCKTNWGVAFNSGVSSIDIPYVPYLREAVTAAAEQIRPGERRTVTVSLGEYYEYYPLIFSLDTDGSVGLHESFDAGVELSLSDEQKDFMNLFRIPVGENEILDITVEKNEAGELIDLDCRNGATGVEFVNLSAFGQEGAYHAYYLKEWERTEDGDYRISEKSADPGEDYGIFYYPFYYPFIGESNHLALDLTGAGKICDLEPGIQLVEMMLNEDENRLYLVTSEGRDLYLNVYETNETGLTLSQKIFVRSVDEDPGGENTPYWSHMSVQEEGVLMVWQDGSFAFAACEGEKYRFWRLEQDCVLGPIFPYENAWDFDGERLALAAFVYERDGVNLAVYTENGLAYLGLCEHSGMNNEIQAVEWE